MSTSTVAWSTHLSNGTSGVAGALVSVVTALLSFRGADNRAEDGARMLKEIESLEQLTNQLELQAVRFDELDLSSFAEKPRAELCETREMLVSGFASMDVVLKAAAGLRHLVDTRPDVLPPEIAKPLLSAIPLIVRAVERAMAFRRRVIASIEHEIDSQDVELLLSKPLQPVPWDDARKAFGLT